MKFNKIKNFPMKDNVFEYEWLVTKFCNYRCSYCYQRNIHECNFPDINDLKEQAVEIARIIKEHKTEKQKQLHLIGGEISTLPIADIVDPIIPYIDKICAISNGSGIKNISELIERCLNNNKKMILLLSFHEEFATIDEFINMVKMFREKYNNNNFYLNTCLVVNDNNYKIIKELIYKLKENNINFTVSPESSIDSNNNVSSEEAIDIINLGDECSSQVRNILYNNDEIIEEYKNRGKFFVDVSNELLTFYGSHCNINKNCLLFEDWNVSPYSCIEPKIKINYKKFKYNFIEQLDYIICHKKDCKCCKNCIIDLNTQECIKANENLQKIKNYTEE